MKDLIIVGAGDCGREAIWVAERMNEQNKRWNILGFVDDAKAGQEIDGYPVLGNVSWLERYSDEVYVVCAITNGQAHRGIWERLKENIHIQPATLIDPTVVIGKKASISPGSIVYAGVVIGVFAQIKSHCIVHYNCTVGHDTVLEDYTALYPGCNIAGRVRLGRGVLGGTGCKILQQITVVDDVILGAGAVVCRDISEPGTYVGVPAKRIK